MKQKTIKIISIVLVIILIANFLLFAFNQSNIYVFWFVIALIAICAYWLIPKMKK